MSADSFTQPPNGPPEFDAAQLAAMRGLEDEDEGGIDIQRYLAALQRHKWYVVGLALVGLAGGLIAALQVKPQYVARAAIQLPSPSRLQRGDPTSTPPIVDGVGWIELLRSFQVMDEVVRQRRSYLKVRNVMDTTLFAGFDLSPAFVPGSYTVLRTADGRVRLMMSASAAVLEEAAAGDSLGRSVGFRWVPAAPAPGRTVEFQVNSLRDAAVELSGNLETVLSKDGSLLRLSLKGENSPMTAAVLNDVVGRFVDVASALKREKLTTVTRVLGEQLATARADLSAAETELQRFKVETITLPSDGGTAIASGLAETANPARQAFFQLRTDREQAERDRTAIARALAAPADGSFSLAISLGTIASVRESQQISALLQQITSKRASLEQLRVAFAAGHPQIRSLETEVRGLEQQLAAQARALMGELEVRVAEFDQRIGASSREMQQMPVRFTEEARRDRNVQVAQMIYTQLQSAYEQARLSELSAVPDIRLLDAAVPPTAPERDSAFQFILIGLFGGIGLGLVVAIGLDYFDPRIRYPDQVTRDLGLPILGALPMLGRSADGTPIADDVAALLEATRATRMSLLYAHGTAGPFVTTVTSPSPGDGKSFASANIAKAFAASGRRTILIDADNRRGVLHRAFGVERKPGLMELLQGKATLDEVVVSIPDAGIEFLPTGTRLAAAPEMFASQQMQQLMMELRGRYQAIIVDSPPLGAGVDPVILASLTGTLVLVVRNGVTDRAFAGARLDVVQRLPMIRILGAILNDVRGNEGLYRYYSYIPGYRSEDEVESEEPVVRRIGSGTS